MRETTNAPLPPFRRKRKVKRHRGINLERRHSTDLLVFGDATTISSLTASGSQRPAEQGDQPGEHNLARKYRSTKSSTPFKSSVLSACKDQHGQCLQIDSARSDFARVETSRPYTSLLDYAGTLGSSLCHFTLLKLTLAQTIGPGLTIAPTCHAPILPLLLCSSSIQLERTPASFSSQICRPGVKLKARSTGRIPFPQQLPTTTCFSGWEASSE